MSFVSDLVTQMDKWDDNDEPWLIDEFWENLAENRVGAVGKHKITVLKVDGGPNTYQDWVFAVKVDSGETGGTYVIDVDYDSYEYSGNQFVVYEAEPFEFTETRYKRVARMR